MMRSWVNSSWTRKLLIVCGTLSVAAHVVLIVAWVIGTLPDEGIPRDSISNHIFYIPPPDRVPTQGGSREAVHYITLAEPGLGTGEGPRMMGEARPVTADITIGRDTKGTDSVVAPAVAPTTGPDSVYSILDVDTAVVRSSKSAAPAYPLKLLEAHVQGFVNAQYIVDTTGFADTTSFTVLQSTHKEFITAVKEALPYMRFQPAKIGALKVRQLVQQQFSFKINDTGVVAPRKRP